MRNLLLIVVGFFASIGLAFATVNINTATQAELQTLNGIGATKAKAILDYRTKNGAFKSVDDLEKVPGIGTATLSKIKTDVSLTGKTTPAAEAKKEEKSTKAAEKTDKVIAPEKVEKVEKVEKTDKPSKAQKREAAKKVEPAVK